MEATRDEMLLVINDFLASVAETIIMSSDIQLNTNYVVLSNWINSSGEVVKLVLTGRTILDAYSKRGTSKCIEHVQIVETLGNKDFVYKFYKSIKNV